MLPEYRLTSNIYRIAKKRYGIEHPFLEGKIDEAMGSFDTKEPIAVQQEVEQWVFDNAVMIPMYKVGWVFQVGPSIDIWDMVCCDARALFDLEYVPHRR